jgi:hypothetical protein
MATGREMYKALKHATSDLPAGSTFTINPFDKIDLCKLTVGDLEKEDYSSAIAERVSQDLMTGSLRELGASMALCLVVDKGTLTLIPGEGFRRAADALKDDPQSLDDMLAELDGIRHGRG